MGNYNFNEDIILGEDGERVVVRHLISLGGILESYNKDNRYDLIMGLNNKRITYEVKTDVYCREDGDTGNMFIEFECRGNESGINVCIADWFVTYYPNMKELWYICVKDLKGLISENEFRVTEFSGDSGSNTRGYLIPRYQYKNNFRVYIVKNEWVR